MSSDPTRSYLSRLEAAELLAVSIEWLKRRLADGDLPHYKFGRSVRIHRNDLEQYVAGCRRARTGAAS